MSLTQVENPSFSLKIKELGNTLKIRSMRVSEHKSIQQARDIGSPTDVAQTVGDVVEACTNNVVNQKNTSQYLTDFVFLNIYMNSVENETISRYTCNSILKNEDGESLIDKETGDYIQCDAKFDVALPLSSAKIMYPDNYLENSEISIDKNIVLYLKAPSLSSNIEIDSLNEDVRDLIKDINDTKDDDNVKLEELTKSLNDKKIEIINMLMFAAVNKILDNGSDKYPGVDFTKEEFLSWLDNCPSSSIIKINKFLSNSPIIGHDLKITCPKCGNSEEIKLRGLRDFFS